MSATEFKATCLAVLDEVNQSGGSVNLTKRGKLVATLQAVENRGGEVARKRTLRSNCNNRRYRQL